MRADRNPAWTMRSIPISVAVIAAVLMALVGPRALAQASCSYDAKTQVLSVTLAPADGVTLSVGDGDTILVDDVACATIGAGEQPASAVLVVGTETADETVAVSQRGIGGPFPFNFRFDVRLGGGASDEVTILGGDEGETFTFDGSGMHGSLQTSLSGVEVLELDAGGGDDTADANGIDADTGSLDLPVTIRGGPGTDTLVGGPRDDRILGDEGDDILDGGPGIDRLHGGAGVDTCLLDLIRMSCDPRIEATPSTVAPAASLTLRGAGWYPENGNVELAYVVSVGAPPEPVTAATPDESWAIEATLDAPSTDGTYSAVACQPCSDPDAYAERATQAFTVRPASAGPTISVVPDTVEVGGSLEVSGRGWDPAGGPIDLFATLPGAQPGDPFATVRADADGTFAERFDVPQLDPDTYEITACQRCGEPDATAASTSFAVRGGTVPTATIELRPPQAAEGDRLEVVGSGWDPDAGRVQVFLDPSGSADAAVAFGRAGSDGSFVISFDVPDLPAGAHTVLACQRCDARDRTEATAPLTVATAATPWWLVVLGSALLIGAVVAVTLAVRRARGRRLHRADRVRVRLRPEVPEVRIVPERGGSPPHTVRLAARGDPGVQRIRERSPR